jgi:hypothetical protein
MLVLCIEMIMIASFKLTESSNSDIYCCTPIIQELGVLYPVWSWWGTYRGRCSRRDGAWLRQGVGRTAHALNNPHVTCTGVYYA